MDVKTTVTAGSEEPQIKFEDITEVYSRMLDAEKKLPPIKVVLVPENQDLRELVNDLNKGSENLPAGIAYIDARDIITVGHRPDMVIARKNSKGLNELRALLIIGEQANRPILLTVGDTIHTAASTNINYIEPAAFDRELLMGEWEQRDKPLNRREKRYLDRYGVLPKDDIKRGSNG